MKNAAEGMSQQIIAAIRKVVLQSNPVLHEPYFDSDDHDFVNDCIASGFVSSVGAYVEKFEHQLAHYTGASHCVAVVNGTAALHMALLIVGVEQYDEVLVPTLCFVATANAVAYCNASPHFIDCDPTTLGINPDVLDAYLAEVTSFRDGFCINRKTGQRISALMLMHTFGHIGDVEQVLEVAKKYRIAVIEDAAEALGSWKGGQSAGTFSGIGVLSFNGNKTITTGGGGALLLSDPILAKRAKHLTTTAKVSHPWAFVHDEIGYNYRMPNINAALGCAQLKKLEAHIIAKRQLFDSYSASFSKVDGARIFPEPPHSKSNYWLQAILLDKKMTFAQERVLEATNSVGIMTRPPWTPLHRLPHFSRCSRMPVPFAEEMSKRLINIPSSPAIVLSKVR